MGPEIKKNIVFFDGHCNLCNGAISFLIKIDSRNKLLYAPLSGKYAEELSVMNHLPSTELSVIYFKNENEVYYYSDAVIQIMTEVSPLGKSFYIFKLIPRFIRDSLYKFIGRNRYRVFGKSESCRLPTEEEQSRFLD